jgi:hypothetical protein
MSASDSTAQAAHYRRALHHRTTRRHVTLHDHDSGLFTVRQQAETPDSKPLTNRTGRCRTLDRLTGAAATENCATAAPSKRLVVAPRVPEVNLRRLIALGLDYINGAWTIPATSRPNSNNSHTSPAAVYDSGANVVTHVTITFSHSIPRLRSESV